ncbi:MAG: metal-dependent transcriptional regulator [Candidatus Margulisbacteria bacterium]|nr:metal-dependent transcriptional regulator [Candidatus Margulisiibacteriota bacterium]
MKLSTAMEDYLEAILMIRNTGEKIRVKSLAQRLNIKPPSVIDMLKNMANNGYVVHESRGDIQLTKTGSRIAGKIKKRHELLTKFFHEILGLDIKTANIDACKVEHFLSRKTCERLVEYMDSIEKQTS